MNGGPALRDIRSFSESAVDVSHATSGPLRKAPCAISTSSRGRVRSRSSTLSSIAENEDEASAGLSTQSNSELDSGGSFEDEPCGIHPHDDALFEVLRSWNRQLLPCAEIYEAIEAISRQRIKERPSFDEMSPLDVELDFHRPLFTVIHGLLFPTASEDEELAALDEMFEAEKFDTQDFVTLETLRVIRNRPNAELREKLSRVERKVLEK